MNTDDYKNLIKVEKECLVDDFELAKKIVEDNELMTLFEYFTDSKNKIYNILVYRLLIGEVLSKEEYRLIVEKYYSEDYQTNSFDYFEILFKLDMENKLPMLGYRLSNKDYLIIALLEKLKNCIDSRNYTYDAVRYFIEKYCNLVKKYNKKYKKNFFLTCKYNLKIFALKIYLEYKIKRKI